MPERSRNGPARMLAATLRQQSDLQVDLVVGTPLAAQQH